MAIKAYPRPIRPPRQSFFLLGVRGVGKSTWVRQHLPDAPDIASLEIPGEHRRDDPVLGAPANDRSVFGLAEDQVGTEEGRGEGPGNDVREGLQNIRF